MAGGRRSHGQGTFWGDLIGPNPTDRGKAGTKRSLLVDGEGGPLSIVVAGARVVVEQSDVRKELDDCPDGTPHHFLIAPPAGSPLNPGRCKHCGIVESFPSYARETLWIGAGPKQKRQPKPVHILGDDAARLESAITLANGEEPEDSER